MASSQAALSEITLKGSTAIVTEFFGYSINSCARAAQRRGYALQSSFRRRGARSGRRRRILYQRGIYPPETFSRVRKYGLTMLITTDDGLKSYLSKVLAQLSGPSARRGASHATLARTPHAFRPRPAPCLTLRPEWLLRGDVQKLVIVVTGTETNETLERWAFNVETDREVVENGCAPLVAPCATRFPAGLYRIKSMPLTVARAHRIPPCSAKRSKSEKEITQEIQAIIRQITASVTFLPILEEPCTCSERRAGRRPVPLGEVQPPYPAPLQAHSTSSSTPTPTPRCPSRGRRATRATSPTPPRSASGASRPRCAPAARPLLPTGQGCRSHGAAPGTGLQVHKVDAMVAYKNAEEDDV